MGEPDMGTETEEQSEARLRELCGGVRPVDHDVLQASRERWDGIAKPLNGLGLLERMISRIAAIQGREQVSLRPRAIVVMCADNGVVAEGVTQTGSEVTAAVADSIARGTASVSRMARRAQVDVVPVDIGVSHALSEPGIWDWKIAPGTRNLRREAAMSRGQAVRGIWAGIHVAGRLKEEGYLLLGTGEMGIGNTTTASAMASVLLGLPPEQVTGAGAGLSEEGVRRKAAVIREAIRLHQPDRGDPVAVLATVGGLDIAGLVGVFLGGAVHRMPVVVDGMISAVAALTAARLCPAAAAYMLPSHMGREPACGLLMEALGLTPVIHAKLALGEGTGAALLFPALDMALEVYQEPTTFADIRVPAYHRFGEDTHGSDE